MSKFDDLAAEAHGVEPPMELDMTLTCQVCNLPVDRGMYFMTDKLLVWVCDAGHKSHIENFNLF